MTSRSQQAQVQQGKKLCPHLILEGTRLTHKTDIALSLNEHPRIVGRRSYRYHSPVVSAEWCGFTNQPWGRGLINFEPQEETRAMETYRTWVRLFELQRYYSWIVDRFHLSTRAYQRSRFQRDYDFDWLEERLVALNFRLVLCTRRPDSFEAARTIRLKISQNPRQYDDLAPFIEEQDLLREFAAVSRLQVLELDVTAGDIEGACETVTDWMEATGGLYQA